MGLEAIYQKPNLSRALAGQRIYPYLLRNLAVTQPDQVWATDITYVPGAGRAWVSLRGPRLAQPLRARVRTVQHARRKLLRARRPSGHRAARRAGNLQHRPRLSVHVGRVPGPLAAPRGEVVDGRQRPVPRQCLRRATLADGEIRGGLSEVLQVDGRRPRAIGPILRLLQPAPTALLPRRRHARRNLPRDALRCHQATTKRPEIKIQGVPGCPALLTAALPGQGGACRPPHHHRGRHILNTPTGRELRSPAPLLCFHACPPPFTHSQLSRPNCPNDGLHFTSA